MIFHEKTVEEAKVLQYFHLCSRRELGETCLDELGSKSQPVL